MTRGELVAIGLCALVFALACAVALLVPGGSECHSVYIVGHGVRVVCQ